MDIFLLKIFFGVLSLATLMIANQVFLIPMIKNIRDKKNNTHRINFGASKLTKEERTKILESERKAIIQSRENRKNGIKHEVPDFIKNF